MPEPATPAPAYCISMGGVSVDGGGRRLVENIDLQLGRQRLAMVGPNGSGKTRFLRVMLDEDAPVVGTVRRQRAVIGAVTSVVSLGTGAAHQCAGERRVIFFGEALRGPRPQGNLYYQVCVPGGKSAGRCAVGAWQWSVGGCAGLLQSESATRCDSLTANCIGILLVGRGTGIQTMARKAGIGNRCRMKQRMTSTRPAAWWKRFKPTARLTVGYLVPLHSRG
jgi:hypothetical protein